MPNKDETRDVDLQVLKVDDQPRTFGEDGKAWGVVTEESILPGEEMPFKLEVYQEDGAKSIGLLKGQGPKTFTIKFSNIYQNTQSWKVVKAPGYEAGSRGGGGRKGPPPEAYGRMVVQEALLAAATHAKPGADPTDVIETASIYIDFILTEGKRIAPQMGGSSSGGGSSPNGQGAKEELESLRATLLERFKEADDQATDVDVEHALFEWAKKNKIGWPIEGSKIAPAIAWLKEQLAGASAE